MQFFTLLTVNVCKIRQKENGKTKIGANVSSMQSTYIKSSYVILESLVGILYLVSL